LLPQRQPEDPTVPAPIHVVDHPLVQHKLTLLRCRETPTHGFRALLHEVSMLLAYEATRNLPTTPRDIHTPLAPMRSPVIDARGLVIVSILRAGNGILDGMLQVLPWARVGHVGLYRDHDTLEAVEYYFKVPEPMADRDVIVVDPMLATGHSAVAALSRVKATGPRSVCFVCLLAAPEGIAALQQAHPDVPIHTAAIDERLDERGYILPGLGDAGDRLYGTD
jgi:uracil phosphoribosyltransferase